MNDSLLDSRAVALSGVFAAAIASLERIPAAIAQDPPVDLLQAVVGFAAAYPSSRAPRSRVPQFE